MKIKSVPLIVILLFITFFIIFFKGLKNSNIYVPNINYEKEIPSFTTQFFDTNMKINSDEIFKEDYYYLMIVGLLLSVFLVATLATYFANYIKDHKWLGYVGIFVIIIVAIQLIVGGFVNLEILSIQEKYEFLFSI